MKLSDDHQGIELKQSLIQDSDFFVDTPLDDAKSRKSASRIDWKLTKSISTEIWNRILCFDYSIAIIVLLYAIGQLEDDQGDNTLYKAAAPLILYSFNLGVAVTTYSAIPFITLGSQLVGKMTAPIVEKDDGASNQGEIQNAIQNYSRLPRNTALVCTPFMLGAMSAVYFADQFWEKLGETSDVTRLVAQFTHPGAFVMPLFLNRMINDLILYLRGKAGLVSKINLSSLCVGLLLADTLTFNFFDQLSGPELGLLGLILALFEHVLASGLVMNGYITHSSEFKDFDFRKRRLPRWSPEDSKQIKELIPLAFAYESTLIAEISTQFINSRLAGDCGVNQLAAWSYVVFINFIGDLWRHGVAQVAQQIVGESLGSDDKVLAKKRAKYSLAVSLLFPLPNLFFLALIIYPQILTMMDTSEPSPEVQEYSNTLIRSGAAIAWVFSGQFTMVESLKPTSDYKRPTYLGAASLGIGAVASYFLSQTKLGVYGVIAGSGIGEGLRFLTTLPDWLKHFGSSGVSEERASSSWCSCFGRITKRFRSVDAQELQIQGYERPSLTEI